jgi:hypothetical protein
VEITLKQIEDGGQHHFVFQYSSNRQSQIANRKSPGGFQRLQRIGNDAAANDNLTVLIKFQVGREMAQKAQKNFFCGISPL